MHANNNWKFIEHFRRLKTLYNLKKNMCHRHTELLKRKRKVPGSPLGPNPPSRPGLPLRPGSPFRPTEGRPGRPGGPAGPAGPVKEMWACYCHEKHTHHYHNSMLYTTPVNMPGLIQISLEALAKSWPDDSCTPACSRTGSVLPKPDTISQKQIRSGLVLHSMIQAV